MERLIGPSVVGALISKRINQSYHEGAKSPWLRSITGKNPGNGFLNRKSERMLTGKRRHAMIKLPEKEDEKEKIY